MKALSWNSNPEPVEENPRILLTGCLFSKEFVNALHLQAHTTAAQGNRTNAKHSRAPLRINMLRVNQSMQQYHWTKYKHRNCFLAVCT